MSSRFCVWRWLEREDHKIIKAVGKFVRVSQTPVPLSITVRLDHVPGLVAIGIANTNSPPAIAGCLRRKSGGSKIAFAGIFLQPKAATLFHNKDDNIADVPALDAGTYLNLTIAKDTLAVAKNGHFIIRAKLPAPWRNDSYFYAAAVMDSPMCSLVPCWSITA